MAAVFCMLAGLVVAKGGLASVDNVRHRLNLLRAGRERRMDGSYPAEVQPLVDDLNALLDHRDQADPTRHRQVRRPRARAEDAARHPGAGG